jgi:hypothetical protein
VYDVVQVRATAGERTNFVSHSQGALLLNAGLNTLTKRDFLNINFGENKKLSPTFSINGAPIRATTMQDSVTDVGFKFSGSSANKNDFVAEVLGGNKGEWRPSEELGTGDAMPMWDRIISTTNVLKFFDKKYPVSDANGNQLNKTSPHSRYVCVVNCGDISPTTPEQANTSSNSVDQERKETP